jgi:hypothetical protein
MMHQDTTTTRNDRSLDKNSSCASCLLANPTLHLGCGRLCYQYGCHTSRGGGYRPRRGALRAKVARSSWVRLHQVAKGGWQKLGPTPHSKSSIKDTNSKKANGILELDG